MVGGNGRFERGEHIDLPVGRDLENRAAAIAYIEIVFLVEREPGGHAHAFDENRHAAVGGGLIDHAVETAGYVQHALGIEGHGRGVHQIVDERLDVVVEVDFEDRYCHFLPARAAKRGVDVAESVHRWISHRVQA